MKQEERRQQTIRLLLEATKELIREKGCHAVTMRDIMEKSGLSKGSIFHYVATKDELFAWVLQERLEQTNERFMRQVGHGGADFAGPMQQIAATLPALEDREEITNKVLIYLLGKDDDPTVEAVLKRFYDRWIELSRQWIVTGQEHGVIPESVDADKTAELFVLLSLGLRTRASLPVHSTAFSADDFAKLIIERLSGK